MFNRPEDIQDLALKFLAQEIDLGLSFVSVAHIEYTHGRHFRGDEYRARADHACAEAERRLNDAELRRWSVKADIRDRLRALRQQIAALSPTIQV